MCEVQCVLAQYRDVRLKMHEIYKVHRADNGNRSGYAEISLGEEGPCGRVLLERVMVLQPAPELFGGGPVLVGDGGCGLRRQSGSAGRRPARAP